MKTEFFVTTVLLFSLTTFTAKADPDFDTAEADESVVDYQYQTVESAIEEIASEATATVDESEEVASNNNENDQERVIDTEDKKFLRDIEVDPSFLKPRPADMANINGTVAAAALSMGVHRQKIQKLSADDLSLKDLYMMKKALKKMDAAIAQKLQDKIGTATLVKPEQGQGAGGSKINCMIKKGEQVAHCHGDKYRKVQKAQIGQSLLDKDEEFMEALVDKLNRADGGKAVIADTQESDGGFAGGGGSFSIDAD